MKKIIFLASLLCSLTCYADTSYVVNQTECVSSKGDNLSGCFQNMTGGSLDVATHLSLRRSIYYEDRYPEDRSSSPILYVSNVLFSPKYFAVVAGSTDDLKKNRITLVEYALMDNESMFSNDEIPGCKIILRSDSASQTILSIVKNKSGNLLCHLQPSTKHKGKTPPLPT